MVRIAAPELNPLDNINRRPLVKAEAGTIAAASGAGFSVSGSHGYLKKGVYNVTVAIKDHGGSIATATSTINAGGVKK